MSAQTWCFKKSEIKKQELYKKLWEQISFNILNMYNYNEFETNTMLTMNLLDSLYYTLKDIILNKLYRIDNYLIINNDNIYEITSDFFGNDLIRINISNRKLLYSETQTFKFIKKFKEKKITYNLNLIKEFWKKYPNGILYIS